MSMERKPIPFTATSEGSVYIANPRDWYGFFLITFKWCLILAGLGVSGYLAYLLFTT